MLKKSMVMDVVVMLAPMSAVDMLMQVTDDDKCSELLVIENESDNDSSGSGGHVGCGCGLVHVA
jgi:hypothetical protein